MKIKESYVYILESFIIISIVILAIFYGSYSKINDVKNVDRAEKTIQKLIELRIAIEKYYQISGKFPDLEKDGVKDNLALLDYTDPNGRKISFAEIYGKTVLEFTEETDSIPASNTVYDIENFNEGNFKGGWNYNYSGSTGELHVNLAKDAYNQKIDWKEE